MALPKYLEQKDSRLGYHTPKVLNDAEEWKDFYTARGQNKQELIDQANELKRAADRLLKLAGRL